MKIPPENKCGDCEHCKNATIPLKLKMYCEKYKCELVYHHGWKAWRCVDCVLRDGYEPRKESE